MILDEIFDQNPEFINKQYENDETLLFKFCDDDSCEYCHDKSLASISRVVTCWHLTKNKKPLWHGQRTEPLM